MRKIKDLALHTLAFFQNRTQQFSMPPAYINHLCFWACNLRNDPGNIRRHKPCQLSHCPVEIGGFCGMLVQRLETISFTP